MPSRLHRYTTQVHYTGTRQKYTQQHAVRLLAPPAPGRPPPPAPHFSASLPGALVLLPAACQRASCAPVSKSDCRRVWQSIVVLHQAPSRTIFSKLHAVASDPEYSLSDITPRASCQSIPQTFPRGVLVLHFPRPGKRRRAPVGGLWKRTLHTAHTCYYYLLFSYLITIVVNECGSVERHTGRPAPV